MIDVSDVSAHLPVWVRRRDGSQVPFEADRICQSLFDAAESLGPANAFLIRELTDAVLHFLAQQSWDAVPTTVGIADEIAKIVREVGQPLLARRYVELRQQTKKAAVKQVTIACDAAPDRFVKDCLDAYALEAVFARDVAAAIREGLLVLRGQETPATLVSLVLQTPRLAELPWWIALDDWRASGGDRWIVESPEWLCTPQMHPALTPHLCERLLSLPTVGQRAVELHLNVAEPPRWSASPQVGPLFAHSDDEDSGQERVNFLDGLLERWKALDTPKTAAIAWHLHARSFQDDMQCRLLQTLVRQALLGRPIRFVFDRPNTPIPFAEGLDRKAPGVLLELGIDLLAFAQRPEIASDGVALLQKLPTLARIAVSAVAQKRDYLRALPDASPLHQRFLIERSSGSLTPLGLDEVTRAITGASLTRSPLSLDFALKLLQTLRDALHQAGRAIGMDLRLECPALARVGADAPPLDKQLETAGILHACAGAGTAMLLVSDEAAANPDDLIERLRWAWQATAVTRLSLQRAAPQQGELPI